MAWVMKMKKFLRSLDTMSDAAFCMLSGCLQVACTMLLCSFLFLVHRDAPGSDLRELWLSARELASSAAGVLLIGIIAGAFLEERSRR